MSPSPPKVLVEVDGRQLALSNLDKLLYPPAPGEADGGFTKGQVLDYYSRIAPVLLPHLAGRPLTFKRYPDGVAGKFFFEKNAPSHRPPWLRTATLPSPGSTKNRETITYAVLEDLPGLMWAANLATLELHVPMWRVDEAGAALAPDLLVFDLDPGAPATIVECCVVAGLLRDELAADGLQAVAKTSGSKGLQLYVPIEDSGSAAERGRGAAPPGSTSAYARALAQRLETRHPELVVSNMKKDLRGGKVLVDWSQNNPAKTTVAVYSLRARPEPTVSTPVTWDEVTGCAREGDPDLLRFRSAQVLARVDALGELFARALGPPHPLPG